jgi:hypothetical protein
VTLVEIWVVLSIGVVIGFLVRGLFGGGGDEP